MKPAGQLHTLHVMRGCYFYADTQLVIIIIIYFAQQSLSSYK